MTGWRAGLAALLTWAFHFFLAYALMLTFPESHSVKWMTLALGLACIAFLALLLRSAPRNLTVISATLLAAVAIAWQSIVGLF